MKPMAKIVVASVLMYIMLLYLKTLLSFSPTLNVIVYAILGVIIYLVCILVFKVVRLKELKEQFSKNKGE